MEKRTARPSLPALPAERCQENSIVPHRVGAVMRSYFTVTRKVALGYLVIMAFSLFAVGYALVSLHDHNRRTEQLVGGQFQAFSLLRDIRQNLLAQDNLEKQLVIMR